jgi:hypothetical protein
VTWRVVSGTPTWAVVVAYGAVFSVVPSAVWRIALGLGAELGTTQAWRDFQDVPGSGTWYVVGLSVLSVAAASLTLGLIYQWGEAVPRWVPIVGGRPIPTLAVVALTTVGAFAVLAVGVNSLVNWNRIIGLKGRPEPGWYELATAAYLPALLWGPLLLAATGAYWRRRVTDDRS